MHADRGGDDDGSAARQAMGGSYNSLSAGTVRWRPRSRRSFNQSELPARLQAPAI